MSDKLNYPIIKDDYYYYYCGWRGQLAYVRAEENLDHYYKGPMFTIIEQIYGPNEKEKEHIHIGLENIYHLHKIHELLKDLFKSGFGVKL